MMNPELIPRLPVVPKHHRPEEPDCLLSRTVALLLLYLWYIVDCPGIREAGCWAIEGTRLASLIEHWT
jgi:hypothetical protein